MRTAVETETYYNIVRYKIKEVIPANGEDNNLKKKKNGGKKNDISTNQKSH